MAEFNLDIYLSYMGCPCGPSSPEQDELADQLQQILIRLKEKYKDRVAYTIYALNQHLHQFRSRPELAEILQSQGKKGLPAVFVNEHLVFQGVCPSFEDLEKSLLQEINPDGQK